MCMYLPVLPTSICFLSNKVEYVLWLTIVRRRRISTIVHVFYYRNTWRLRRHMTSSQIISGTVDYSKASHKILPLRHRPLLFTGGRFRISLVPFNKAILASSWHKLREVQLTITSPDYSAPTIASALTAIHALASATFSGSVNSAPLLVWESSCASSSLLPAPVNETS